MKKIIYTLSAFMMACIISFSGFGGTYINAHATSVGIKRPNVWNDDESVWDNILRHLKLYASVSGVFANPLSIAYNFQDFIDFMGDNGYSHDIVHGIFCDCDNNEHTSFNGQEHGGGGFVRDGISVDDDGNVTYSDEVSDLFHGFILDFLDSNSGYILFKTFKPSDISAQFFVDKDAYNNFTTTVENFDMVYCRLEANYDFLFYIPTNNLYLYNADKISYVTEHDSSGYSIFTKIGSNSAYFNVLEDDWSYHKPYMLSVSSTDTSYSKGRVYFSDKAYSLSDLVPCQYNDDANLFYQRIYNNGSTGFIKTIFSSDGRNIKVWYDLNAFKNYDVGKQMYYVTDSFNNYDSTIDNSITITSQEYAYYNDNSTTIYQTIQNNIDNSGNSDLTEKDVQDIVDSAVQDIKDSIANSGNQGGNDSGDSDNGGNGLGDLVGGIGKLLDTILSLIGKVMGVVADFTQSILDLFSGFTVFTDGFSNFLSGAFGFIPQEIWNVIQVGLSLMILLAVIKFLRK